MTQFSDSPSLPPGAANLLKRFEQRNARVGVIGLGYVGLPLSITFVNAGFGVLGFDIDPAKIDNLESGRSYFRHIQDQVVEELLRSGRFAATTDFSRLSEMDAVILCVPTPLSEDLQPDLTYITQTAETLARHLRASQLVVLESTTYPGTTEDVLKPILEQSGLRSGADFFLAYSPEREDPGNAQFSTAAIPKVVGGDGPTALQLATALYGSAIVETVPVSTTATAEAAKLTENIFRAVNIALVNELKVIYGKMGIDVWEVIEAAKTKPFGFMPFYPGPGLGGHCIPIDPFYLAWRARQVGQDARFIELAGEINTAMPEYVIRCLQDALGDRHGKALKGARILLIGVAYKKNVDDTRESPALRIIDLLEAAGTVVAFHDPFVTELPKTRRYPNLAGRLSESLSASEIGSYDAVLICTDHDGIDYRAIADNSTLLVDTRNVIERVLGERPETLVKT